MGYSKTLEVGDSIELGGTTQLYAYITDGGADYDFGTFAMPSTLIGALKYAFVDFWIGQYYSSGLAVNGLNGAVPIVATLSGSSTTCMTLPNGSLHTETTGINPGKRIYGSTNVKNRFRAGYTTSFNLSGAKAFSSNLNLVEIQPIVRLVFE